MSRIRKWDETKLKAIVRESRSVRGVILKLGLQAAGGNYATIQSLILENQLDTSHFTRQGWRKGNSRPVVQKRPLEQILVSNSRYQSYKLKKRLFSEGLKKAVCEQCGWASRSQDGRIPLELDHVNGIRTDNRLSNLRVLCPNCHSLQPTHRGINIRRTR